MRFGRRRSRLLRARVRLVVVFSGPGFFVVQKCTKRKGNKKKDPSSSTLFYLGFQKERVFREREGKREKNAKILGVRKKHFLLLERERERESSFLKKKRVVSFLSSNTRKLTYLGTRLRRHRETKKTTTTKKEGSFCLLLLLLRCSARGDGKALLGRRRRRREFFVRLFLRVVVGNWKVSRRFIEPPKIASSSEEEDL